MTKAAALMWLDVYRCDGLRFDSVHDIAQDAVQVRQGGVCVACKGERAHGEKGAESAAHMPRDCGFRGCLATRPCTGHAVCMMAVMVRSTHDARDDCVALRAASPRRP